MKLTVANQGGRCLGPELPQQGGIYFITDIIYYVKFTISGT